VEITADGRAVADRLLPGIHQVESKVLSALSEPGRCQLLRLLDKVLVRAAEVAAEPPALLEGRRRRLPGR
jgi:DNA-binding MarR family transcriptional regulator